MFQEESFVKFYKRKSILVTGAAGFIGSFLVSRLLDLDSKVIAVASPGSDDWRIGEVKNRIKRINVDLTDFESVRKAVALSSPELVFNLATRVDRERSMFGIEESMKNNFLTAKNVMLAAVENNVKKFIQVGTVGEYGAQPPPFLETQREMPVSPYFLSKAMATHLALLFCRNNNLKTCVVRLAATFGPKQGFGMLIPNLIGACLERRDFDMNPGEQLRDLIFVDDVVGGLLAAGSSDGVIGEIVNIGSGEQYKIKEVVNKINEMMGHPIKVNFGAEPYRPLDEMRFFMNTEKAKKLLHWSAKTDLETALRKTTDWYKDNFYRMTKQNRKDKAP